MKYMKQHTKFNADNKLNEHIDCCAHEKSKAQLRLTKENNIKQYFSKRAVQFLPIFVAILDFKCTLKKNK